LPDDRTFREDVEERPCILDYEHGSAVMGWNWASGCK
jgi:hypothetical protein